MANTAKAVRGWNITKPAARKNVRVRDLPTRARRAGSPMGGAAVYQHNQTDLEFLRADSVRGGSKNEVAVETLEIAHVAVTPR
jgi:hypothetical protein